MDGHVSTPGSGIFIRENGSVRELTREEWDAKFPEKEPVVVAQDPDDKVFGANITHNLASMAREAGIYEMCWKPEELNITHAHQLIPLLRGGLINLKLYPERFKAFNPENGWGNYEGLVEFMTNYLNACEAHPQARVSVWR